MDAVRGRRAASQYPQAQYGRSWPQAPQRALLANGFSDSIAKLLKLFYALTTTGGNLESSFPATTSCSCSKVCCVRQSAFLPSLSWRRKSPHHEATCESWRVHPGGLLGDLPHIFRQQGESAIVSLNAAQQKSLRRKRAPAMCMNCSSSSMREPMDFPGHSDPRPCPSSWN